MYGEGGWCRSCGVPLRPQCGSLVLERRGFAEGVRGTWVPNWQLDALCLEQSLAAQISEQFDVEVRSIGWHGAPPGEASQIVLPSGGDPWFDPEELRHATIERHGTDGATCRGCGVWRWMPLGFGSLPPLRRAPAVGGADVAASPEWFGDGWQAFRQVLVRRPLAELIAAASPRDLFVREVS